MSGSGRSPQCRDSGFQWPPHKGAFFISTSLSNSPYHNSTPTPCKCNSPPELPLMDFTVSVMDFIGNSYGWGMVTGFGTKEGRRGAPRRMLARRSQHAAQGQTQCGRRAIRVPSPQQESSEGLLCTSLTPFVPIKKLDFKLKKNLSKTTMK